MNLTLHNDYHLYSSEKGSIKFSSSKDYLNSICASLKRKKFVCLDCEIDFSLHEIDKKQIIIHGEGVLLAPRALKRIRLIAQESDSIENFKKKLKNF